MQTLCVKRTAPGFTLIELMVVILLIGLALSVGLTLDFSSSPQRLEQQAQQVANITGLLAQEAVLSGVTFGLDFFTAVQDGFETTGMRWLRQEAEDWVPADVGATGAQHEVLFANDIEVQLEVEENVIIPEDKRELDAARVGKQAFSPELLFLPSREITPFILSLSSEDGIFSKVSADLMGRVRVNEDVRSAP